MSSNNVLTIRSEGDPQGRAHIVFRSRPNYSLCGVRLVGKWTPAGDDISSEQVCAKCRESYIRQAEEEGAKWAAWQAGEARPGRLPGDGEKEL